MKDSKSKMFSPLGEKKEKQESTVRRGEEKKTVCVGFFDEPFLS